MIGNPPANLPDRAYFDYAGQSVEELPPGLLSRRNPLAQSSVSAVKDVFTCRRKAFLKNIIGLREPEHPTASVGKAMHAEVEAWHKGALLPDGSRGPAPGPRPTHPSLVAAIDAGIIPAPGPGVLSEEQFWSPTGVAAPDSPDGQLWLKGFLDLIVREGKSVTIPDMKTKGNVNACTRYALTPEELANDPQMGLYGHVFHGTERGLNLVVGHVYLVRDPAIPYARWVPVTLTPDVARRTYLRLLSGAEQMIEDSRCGDWRAVPGNFGKCDKPFKCPFIPLCHGKDTDVVNPYVNDPVAITPPDAASPGTSADPAPKGRKKAAPAAQSQQEITMAVSDDFDAILNAALGKAPKAAAPAPTPPPAAPSPQAAPPPPAPAVKATPIPAGAGVEAGETGDADVGALDAMLASMPKGPKKAPAKAKEAAPPPAKAPAAPAPTPPPAPAPAAPVPAAPVPAAPVPAAPVPAAPAPAAPVQQVLVQVEAARKAEAARKEEVAESTKDFSPPRNPVAMLLVHATTNAPGTVALADLVAKADAVVCERHNRKPGVVKIESMYQLDHGMWRGDFVAALVGIVKAHAAKHGAMMLVATADSPASTTAVEALTALSGAVVWGLR